MSFVNKLANSVTNKTSLLIGRENLAKLTNGINRSLVKSKYRDFMKNGNTIQLISRNSHMALQICQSQNDPNRLIVFANGQIGPDHRTSHWLIEIEPKNGHYKFRSQRNYLSFDKENPCILTDPPIKPKNKADEIRARNEFRLHEILGSDEHFALESVYFPGRYISILPDGSISVSTDKSQDSTHFFVHIIHVYNQVAVPIQPQPQNITPSAHPPSAQLPSQVANENKSSQGNEAENKKKQSENEQESPMNASLQRDPAAVELPQTYSSIFPVLPK